MVSDTKRVIVGFIGLVAVACALVGLVETLLLLLRIDRNVRLNFTIVGRDYWQSFRRYR